MLLHDCLATDEPGFTARPLRPILGEGRTDMNLQYLQGFDAAQRFTRRFAQESYLDRRRKTETWLRMEAHERYGLTLRGHPLYFRWAYIFESSPREEMRTIGIPAAALPANQLTFTVYDSFHNYAAHIGEPYENTPEDLQPAVLTWLEVEEGVRNSQLSHFMHRHPSEFIECQFWGKHWLIEMLRQSESFPWRNSADET